MKIILLFVCFTVYSFAQINDSLKNEIKIHQTLLITEKQNSNGSILGTVIDIDDRSPIDKASIELLGTGMKFITLKGGQFKILNLSEGFYQIRAIATGYDLQTQNNLYVNAGKPATAFFMIKKTGTIEQVESENSTPVPISTKSPNYPEEARKNGIEGVFYFRIDISETGAINTAICVERTVFAENGKLKDGEVMQKYRQAVNQMEKEALEAVWQWKFTPAINNGKKIAANIILPIKFKLSKD